MTKANLYGRISVYDAADDPPIQIDLPCFLILSLNDKYSCGRIDTALPKMGIDLRTANSVYF